MTYSSWESAIYKGHRLYLCKIYLSKHIRGKHKKDSYIALLHLLFFIITMGNFLTHVDKESSFKTLHTLSKSQIDTYHTSSYYYFLFYLNENAVWN